MNAELWAQNLLRLHFYNSYNMKIVYHDWDRAVKRSDDIFGSVLRYKRHELDSCSTNYPAWLLWRLFQLKIMIGSSYPGQPSSKSSWTTGLYPDFGFLHRDPVLQSPRCSSIRRITSGSWIRLMIRISEPHCGQVRGSTSQTFLISSLHVLDGTRGGS